MGIGGVESVEVPKKRFSCRKESHLHTYMINDLINQMVEAGVHLGHQTRKWHPSMKKYLLKDKAGIHIVNLEETEKCLDKACSFLADLARRNKKILFVGCKRQAQEAVREAAEATGQYYVNHRWLGGHAHQHEHHPQEHRTPFLSRRD